MISADDFLPLFTFVLVQAGLPQLLLVKELMVALVDDEDTYGECGAYCYFCCCLLLLLLHAFESLTKCHASSHLFLSTGYYLATLEAATQHICDLADQYEKVARIDTLFDDGEDIFEHFEGGGAGVGGGGNNIR